jgi:hypothetical protein
LYVYVAVAAVVKSDTLNLQSLKGQDLIFDTMPVRAVSPETMLFLGFSAFQGIERERDCGPCMYMLLWLL